MTTFDPRVETLRQADQDPRRTPFTRLRRLRDRVPPLPGSDTAVFWWLVGVLTLLNIIGLVMVLSASSVVSLEQTGSSWTYFIKQAEWLLAGTAVCVLMLYVDLNTFKRFGFTALVLCAIGLVAVHVPGIGVSAHGATRWIGVGPIQMQPSEITKLAMVLFVAGWLERSEGYIHIPRVSVRPVMIVLGVIGMLVMAQKDLGTMVVISLIVFAILMASGVPWRSLLKWLTLATVSAGLLAMGSAYRRARVLSFLNPWADPQHSGYQLIQSRVGLAGGGIFGVGLGQSRAKWGFLPFAHTDFIYAIVGEELGLVGAVVIIGLFLAVGLLGIRVALAADAGYHRFIAVGITTWIVVQAFVNIGAVIGLLPITGIPLPFVSYGGTSLLVTLAASGMLLNVARRPGKALSSER